MKRLVGYAGTLILFVILSCMFRQKKKNIIFFGDSITKRELNTDCYIVRLRKMFDVNGLSGNYKLQGAGVDGNKVNDLYVRMDNDVLTKNPYIVFIWIGVNDVWHKLSGSGTEADKFENIYNDIIKRLQSQNVKVVLVTPAVIGEKKDGKNQQDSDLDLYADIVRKISSQHNCKLVDLRKAFLEYDDKNNPGNKSSGILTEDGVHLSAKGNQLVAEKMMEMLAPFLNQQN